MAATYSGNYRPFCLIGASHYVWEVMNWCPVAALICTPPSGGSQDLFLYISFTTRVPPSDFPGCSSFSVCSHLEMASQILKRQKSKVRKAPCEENEVQPELDSGRVEGSILRRLPCEARTVRMGGAYQFSFDEEVDGTMDVASIHERSLPHRLCVTSWETRQAPVKTHGIVAPFHPPYSPFNKYTQMPAVTRAHTFTRKICGIFFFITAKG